MLRALAPRFWCALRSQTAAAPLVNGGSVWQAANSGSSNGSDGTSSTARGYSSGGGDVDIDQETAAINDAFAQAREDIADARDDADTVYFNESAGVARDAVGEVLGKWEALLAKVPEPRRGELVRSMGLKMEQLKAELKELDELHA